MIFKSFNNTRLFRSGRDRSQKSRPIRLRGGKIYFVEVVMKEGGGGDHVSVGVKIPRSRRIRPVSRRNIFTRPPSMSRFILDFFFIYIDLTSDLACLK